MNQYLLQICVGLGFLLCFVYIPGNQAADNVWYKVGSEAYFSMPLLGSAWGVVCSFPGRDKDIRDRLIVRSKYNTTNTAEIVILGVELRDAGIIQCETTQASTELNLTVYETSTIRDLNVQRLSEKDILVTWKRPLKNPELIEMYTIVVRHFWPRSFLRLSNGPNVSHPSESGVEAHVVTNVPPIHYKVEITTYYPYAAKSHLTERDVVWLRDREWNGPALSIQASALSSDTVLISIHSLDSEKITNLQLTYSNDSTNQNWTYIPLNENERFKLVPNLQPHTTYYFKANGLLRYGIKEAVTHVETPRSNDDKSYELDLQAVRETSSRVRVWWFLQRGDFDRVKRFQVFIKSGTGKKLFAQEVDRINRTIVFRQRSNDTNYTVTVKALDPQEKLLIEKQVNAPAVLPEGDSSEAELQLVAGEIRDKHARLVWTLRNVEPSKLKSFRMLVQENGAYGRQVFKTVYSVDERIARLSNLSANSVFYITLDAIGQDGKAFLISVLRLKTPKPGMIGEPVTGAPKPKPYKGGLQLELDFLALHLAEVTWRLRIYQSMRSMLKGFRVLVQKDGPYGYPVYNTSFSLHRRKLKLYKLPTNSEYCYTVEAIGHDGKAFWTDVLTLLTPKPEKPWRLDRW